MKGTLKLRHSPQDGGRIHETIDCSSQHRVKVTFSNYVVNKNSLQITIKFYPLE